MKFAMGNGERMEAVKGRTGICSGCGAEVIAKCGEQKVHHWAHKGIRHCDSWWESETEWHRIWKGNYPAAWQEISMTDTSTNEIHIADVCSNRGMVLEFQHSHIDPIERRSRELFYNNMIWVVDGTRFRRDYLRFGKLKSNLSRTQRSGIFFIRFPEEVFPSERTTCTKPVVFDFIGNENIEDPRDERHFLYCLMPKKDNETILAVFTRQHFIESTRGSRAWLTTREEKQKSSFPTQPASPLRVNPSITRQSEYVIQKGQFIKRQRF